MEREANNSTQASALAVAEARFPEHVPQVQQLFRASETFRSMCEDLAAAVETLSHVDRLPDRIREARRQEYSGLVDALLDEIEDAIDQAKVVAFRRSGEPKP